MLAKRIIPCLDIKNGSTVKGVNFSNMVNCGDPVLLAKRYVKELADELVFLDITATLDNRNIFTNLVEEIAKNINIPFTVGGGINSIEDADRLLKAGADKISINSGAIKNPELISLLRKKYGSQFIVGAIDAKQIDNQWIVTSHAGKKLTNLRLYDWALELEKLGVGEILFTSMDHDGTKNGYALEAYNKLSGILSIPIIASGGAGKTSDIVDVLSNKGNADAALAASVFHYNTINIKELKKELIENNITVRL